MTAIFFLISDLYGSTSVDVLENFLLDCQKEISRGKLWIALQANVMSDQSMVGEDFEERFKEMISRLESVFYIPTLSKNMRNSGKITEASKNVKADEGNIAYQVSATIDKLPRHLVVDDNDDTDNDNDNYQDNC